MKLYEFNYRNGKLTKSVYEVTETKALYRLENGYFENMFCSQIKKSETGNIRYDSFWGFTTILEEDNTEDFLAKVIERQKEIIEMQKERVQSEETTLAKQKAILEKLVNKDYILVENYGMC